MSLLTSMVSYWKMDEASGNSQDAFDGNTLTQHGSPGPGSTTGVISTCRSFVAANSNYFSRADNAGLSVGDVDYTLACWINPTSFGSGGYIISKGGASDGEYYLLLQSSGILTFQVYGTSGFGSADQIPATTFGILSTGVWHHVVAWHDSVNNVIGISVNATTADTLSHSSGVFDGAGDFNLGDYPSFSLLYNGLMDEVGFWKRVLTSQERTDLYNGGAGLAYPFTGPVSVTVQANYGRFPKTRMRPAA